MDYNTSLTLIRISLIGTIAFCVVNKAYWTAVLFLVLLLGSGHE